MKDIFPHYGIGHFINQPANPTEFEILRFEEMEEPEVADIHKHTFYEILWFDEGHSTQVIDYREYDISPGALFFISPNQVHEFIEWQPLKGGSIFFTEHFFLLDNPDQDKLFELSFLENFWAKPFLIPDNQEFMQIRQTIELLVVEKKRSDCSTEILRSLLRILLAQIQRVSTGGQPVPLPKRSVVLYRAFKNLLERHFREALTASDYAEKLHITQHHLNLTVRQITGKTTSEVLRERSILEAKRLLSFSDWSVSEIASALGYFDLSYFAKVFKAENGIAPIEFKKAMSEKYRKDKVSS
jgi:AraC family transcriptional regulator, transcriptional activator of pobA